MGGKLENQKKKKAIPEEVNCRDCTEYIRPIGCIAPECIIFPERLEAGVVGYEELVSTTFNYNRILFRRLQTSIKYFPGSLWRVTVTHPAAETHSIRYIIDRMD